VENTKNRVKLSNMARKKSNKVNGGKKGKMSQSPAGSYADPGRRISMYRKNSVPQLLTTPKGVRISNTEFYDIVNSLGAGNKGYQIFSPTGLGWLGPIAKSYQRYRIHRLHFSYVPQVATTQGGFVDLGTFYDTDDVVQWGSLSFASSDVLYQCPEFTSGPPYAGGAIRASLSIVRDVDWFGLTVDTSAVHRTYPWLIVDTTSVATDTVANLSRGVALAWRTAAPGLATSTGIGRILISYDIEFINPVAVSSQPALKAGGLPDKGELFPPGTGPAKPPTEIE
jgi:hypothetical protein